jgi:predicted amidohydrolase
MLIISQQEWTAADSGPLAEHVREAVAVFRARSLDDDGVPLLLLPLADPAPDLPEFPALATALGGIAAAERAFLAGAAIVRDPEAGAAMTMGFMIDADGQVVGQCAKISPDLVAGFRDGVTCALGQPGQFPVAKTPIGQAGVLVGEDILFPHYARSLTWAGAEVILNPVAELNDHLYQARRTARTARAFENTSYVVCAGAASRGRPPASARIDWMGDERRAVGEEAFILPDLDIEKLRRRRNAIFSVQPLHLRANLYAEGYRALAKRAPKAQRRPTTRVEWIEEARRRAPAAAEAESRGIDQYDVILTQSVKKIIQRGNDVAALRTENIKAALKLPARLASNPGNKLVVFSEFFMTGQGGHGYRSPITLQRLAIRYPGPEMELLQDFALKHNVYVAGSSFEIDDHFPGHIFNSAFILNDSGELIHRYRKIQCADVWGSLPDTTPSSIYDRYLDTYGYDFLFPVVDTELGRLATMVCFDQAHPEVARMLTQYGAEVIIHPSSEGHGSGRRGWDMARQTRAFENTAYVLSPVPGGEYFDPDDARIPTTQMRGHTKIVNFDGSIQGVADSSGACILSGTVDLKALRRARANPLANLAQWDDPEVYLAHYAAEVGLPNNLWGRDPLENPYVGFKPLKKVLAAYYQRGIFVPPEGGGGAPPSGGLYSRPKRGTATPLADQEKLDGEYIPV